MTVSVNGVSRDMPEGTTVPALLALVGRDPAMTGVAVAVDDAVVSRSRWDETVLADGARVEIVTASQGG
jgi:sulfur carrier protein